MTPESQARVEAFKIAIDLYARMPVEEKAMYAKAGGVSALAERITQWILTGVWQKTIE